MKLIVCSFIFLLGTVWCQNDILLDDGEFDVTIKNGCRENGGEKAFDNLINAKNNLLPCMKESIDLVQTQKSLEKALATGSIDEAVANYCLKVPSAQKCLKKLTDAVEACVEEKQRLNVRTLFNITTTSIDLACDNKEASITPSVTKGAIKCSQSKQQEIQKCVNKFSFSKFSFADLPLLAAKDERCKEYLLFQNCIVGTLETCEDKTLASIISALFKHVEQITHCKNRLSTSTSLESHQRITRSIFGEIGANEAAAKAQIQEALNEVKAKYEPHCLKNGGQKAVDEFRQSLPNVVTCMTGSQEKFQEKFLESAYGGATTDPFQFLCKDTRSNIRKCMNDFVPAAEACSSADEAYGPKFMISMYDSVSDYLCKNDGETAKKLLTFNRDCMTQISNSGKACADKTKYLKQAKEQVLKKNELCMDLDTMKHCITDVASRHCSGDNREVVTGLADAIYAPCSGCRFLIFNALIVLLLLLVKAM